MQAKILALFLILNIKCWSASSLTKIVPILGPVVEIPSETLALWPRVLLRCVVSTTPGVDYTTQWTGPGDVGIIDPTTNPDNYLVTEGNIRIQNGSMLPGTTLTIRRLSYRDAGLYTCSGRSTATSTNEEVPSTSSMVSATIDLQLNIDLSSKFNETIVMATTSDASVELSCEMSAFIRPDSSLIWEGPNNQILANGTKYQITFSNGSRNNTAVDGSGRLVPSRISTLTISNPDKSDRGVYTCSIMGTNATIDLVIMINDANTSTVPATTVSVDDSTETKASTESDATTVAMDGVTTVVAMDGATTAAMDGVTTAAIDGVTDSGMGNVGTTQRLQSGSNGSKSSQNYVNTAVISIIMLAGVLTQLLNG